MTLGSNTTDVNMINIAVTAADGSGRGWQEATQMIPTAMFGNPENFVAGLKLGLPLVNNLRVLFNEYSFNPDGSMNPQFERFLAAAAAEGYQITLTYGSGDTQETGLGSAEHPLLTNAECFAAMQANFPAVQGAWDKMMDWMDGHTAVKEAVYGWELMNEPAGYRNTVKANGSDGTLNTESFVTLWAEHCAALTERIQARADGHILLNGWGYNGDFLTLAGTQVHGVSAIDYIRAAVGPDLVWSAHLFPGWMGTNLVADPVALEARLNQIYAALAGDQILLTETNIDGAVDDPGQAADHIDFFATAQEWFAENGIGTGWYPGAQTGSSHLMFVYDDGQLQIKHQHSLAHALNAFSLAETAPEHAGAERVALTLTEAALRNQPYQIANGEAYTDPLTKFGTAFGYDGADTLQGTSLSNDFLYGGGGNDAMKAKGGDDFLFGQGGDDRLSGGKGIDHLFGGKGNDTLDAGRGANLMAGGQGDDVYLVRSARDMIKEFVSAGTDTVVTKLGSLSLASGNATQYTNIENLTYAGRGDFAGTGNALDNLIKGAGGDDSLSGGAGDDTLLGRGGDDVLTGGLGADFFVFSSNLGHDEVSDFSEGDVIELQNIAGVTTVEDALAAANQIGADVFFDFGLSGDLWLRDTTLATLAGDITVN